MSSTKHKTYRNHRAEPYFSFLKNGDKTIEGRLRKGKYASIDLGGFIQVFNESETDSVLVKVVRVSRYASIREMLSNEKLQDMLPDVDTAEEGLSVYRRFYAEEQEKEFGMVAIEVEVIKG